MPDLVERTFEQNLAQILAATYGSDVRVAIHDALQQAYDHGEGTLDAATDATIDALTAALAAVLNLTVSKTYDAANDRYIYTISQNEGEPTTGNGFVVIDDATTGTDKTWSSSKISAKFDEIDEAMVTLVEGLSDL